MRQTKSEVFNHTLVSKVSWCDHGKASSKVEEEKAHALEVGPQADATEDAQDQAEDWRLIMPAKISKITPMLM